MYFSRYWLRVQELRPALWHYTIIFLVLAAAGLRGCHDRTKIILEHHDIPCRRAATLRQGFGKRPANEFQVGLARDLFYQRWADFNGSRPDKDHGFAKI